MTTTQQTVLVVGATGTIGYRLTLELAKKPGVRVRALVRPAPMPEKKKQEETEFARLGIEMVAGSLEDEESLSRAVEGVYTVLSAVQGGPEVLLDGQWRLLRAAERAGVRRLMPSDFSGNFDRIGYDDNTNYAPRKQFAEKAKESSIEVVHFMNGAFTEVFFAPFLRTFDFPKGEVAFWGTGDEPLDLTSIDDAVKFAAEAALDERPLLGNLQVAGAVTSINQLVADVASVTGKQLARRSKGTIEALHDWFADTKAKNLDPWAFLPSQYQWGLFSGRLKLDPLDNGRYPQVLPQTVRDWLWENRPDTAGANIPYHYIPRVDLPEDPSGQYLGAAPVAAGGVL